MAITCFSQITPFPCSVGRYSRTWGFHLQLQLLCFVHKEKLISKALGMYVLLKWPLFGVVGASILLSDSENNHVCLQAHYSSLKTTNYIPRILYLGSLFAPEIMCSTFECNDRLYLLQMQANYTDVATKQELWPLLYVKKKCEVYLPFLATKQLVYYRFHLRQGIANRMTIWDHIFLVYGWWILSMMVVYI